MKVTRHAIDTMSDTVTACRRSVEHMSDLQSLRRISYAVYCLKKKKQKIQDILKQAQKAGMNPQEIAECLGIDFEG